MRTIVAFGVSETEERSGDSVVEFVDAADAVEAIKRKEARHQRMTPAKPSSHVAEETPLVEPASGVVERGRAGSQIKRGADGDDSSQQIAAGAAQFPRQFDNHVRSERKAPEEDGAPGPAAQMFEDEADIRGETGVVKRIGESFRAAATACIEAMDGKPRGERGMRGAAHVARFARAFEAMRQQQRPSMRRRRLLAMHEDPHLGFGLVVSGCYGKRFLIEWPLPEGSGDGLQMRVAEKRTERRQIYSLEVDAGSRPGTNPLYGLKRSKRIDRDTRPVGPNSTFTRMVSVLSEPSRAIHRPAGSATAHPAGARRKTVPV